MTSAPPTTTGAPRPRLLSTYLWLATVPVVWGFNFVCLKILYGQFAFTVTGLLTVRYILMAPLLAGLLLLTHKQWRIRREHWRYLGIFAFFTVGIYQYLFAKAIELTSAGEAALLISSAPIFTFLITTALGWEKSSRRGLAGVGLGFIGIALVIFGGNDSANIPETHVIGDLVMIAAAILWAAYAIFSKPLLRHYSPLQVTAWAHILGAIVIIPVGFLTPSLVTVGGWQLPFVKLGLEPLATVNWLHLSLLGWGCVLYFAWLAGVYGFVVWYRGVRVLGSSKTMIFQYLVPPVALIVGYLVLGEAPSLLQALGVIITLAGVNIASLSRAGAGTKK